jgi:predicted MFS family arabinose efflux permease
VDKFCPTPQRLGDVYGRVLFLTLLFFLMFISRFIFSPLMPTIGPDVGLSPGDVGTVFFLGSLGLLAGSFLSGVVSARIKHRGTLGLAVLASAVTLMACYFADSLWSVQAAMIVLGFCAGLNQPSVVATTAAIVRREDWGKALSIQQMGPRLTYVIAPFLAVGLLAVFSWQTSLAVLGVFMALCGIAFLFWGNCGGFAGTPPNPALLRIVFGTKSFWIMVLLLALGIGAQAGLYTMIPLYLTSEKGFTGAEANLILGLAGIAPLVTAFHAGWLTDRMGEKRALLLFMVLTGATAMVVGSVSGAALVASIIVLSTLSACFFPPAFSALSRIVQPNLRNLAAGFGPPIGFMLGGGLLPLALGYMGQAYSIGLGIVITGAAVALGGFVAVGLHLLDSLEEGC